MIAAIQGEDGSFSARAARQALGSPTLLPCATVTEVISAVVVGRAERGVVAVENTIVGPLTAHVAQLRAPGVAVIGATTVAVRLCLIGLPGTRLADVRRVAGHPAALAQCAGFLHTHPGMMAVSCDDGAGALRALVGKGAVTDAVIAPREAASRYGGMLLAEGLEDQPDNVTRFVVIARAV